MTVFPAIALLECNNIASGIYAGDAMLKKSPVAMLKAGTISHGRYLVLVGGSVAAVDEAIREGLVAAGEACIDSLFLPDIHPQVYEAMLGKTEKVSGDSLGIVETASIATLIQASDAVIKNAGIAISRLHTGDGYGGKGYALYHGLLEDVEIAVQVATASAQSQQVACSCRLIPNLTGSMREHLNGSLRFRDSSLQILSDGEGYADR